MAIHGGTGGSGKYFNDLHIFGLESRTWKQVQLTGQNIPSPRAFHSLVYGADSGKLYLFGGNNLSECQELFSDFFEIVKLKRALIAMDTIPAELGLLIFSHGCLDAFDLLRIGMTCKWWRELAFDETCWMHMYTQMAAVGSVRLGLKRGKWKDAVIAQIKIDYVAQKKLQVLQAEREERLKSVTKKYSELSKEALASGNLADMSRKPTSQSATVSIKVVLVGDAAVGKTSTLITHMTNKFPGPYYPGIFEFYYADVMYKGIHCNLPLWDTAGQEEYDMLRPLCYPNTCIFLLIFQKTNRESFEHIRSKFAKEVKLHCPQAALVLAGSKLDLIMDDDYTRLREKGELPVTWEEGVSLALEIGAVAYREYSSLTQKGLKELFDTCAAAHFAHTNGTKSKKKECLVQ
eukprot:TRINITY_DN1034_c0_g1_i8.p1 TRINITY_DN1034_c0_g1~~TRINITY_DN1034_c0_g1_i8.p1  ORF type:complete len:404 (+),score=59.69 TRINITY_DN1034_c0_g1_i8:252-1463(+)